MTAKNELLAAARANHQALQELIYAQVFHDTIKGSVWLPPDTPFSPGRWAMGYPALYVLYRVLDETRPRSILELGLGQSTRMIARYNFWAKECRHAVVDHNAEWIDFFKKSWPLPEMTAIVNLPLKEETVTLNGQTLAVTVYDGFAEKFQGKRFDFICVDGPYGSPNVSRVDIVKILPQCLGESFVIMIDDYHRQGEKNTANVIGGILRDHGVKFASGGYFGEKGVGIIASENLQYLCSL